MLFGRCNGSYPCLLGCVEEVPTAEHATSDFGRSASGPTTSRFLHTISHQQRQSGSFSVGAGIAISVVLVGRGSGRPLSVGGYLGWPIAHGPYYLRKVRTWLVDTDATMNTRDRDHDLTSLGQAFAKLGRCNVLHIPSQNACPRHLPKQQHEQQEQRLFKCLLDAALPPRPVVFPSQPSPVILGL